MPEHIIISNFYPIRPHNVFYSCHENWGDIIILLSELIPNLILRHVIKHIDNIYCSDDEIKHLFFLCHHDKIELEDSYSTDPKSSYFQPISLFLISPGCIVFVLPISGKNWQVHYSEGAEWNSNSSGGKTAILQLSDCVIWTFKKAGLELVYCQTHSPGRQKDLFPPCLCVTYPSEKLFSVFCCWIIFIH